MSLDEKDLNRIMKEDGLKVTTHTLKRLRYKLGFVVNPALAQQQVEEAWKNWKNNSGKGLLKVIGKEKPAL
jgi:hypothetical protein